MVQKQLELSIQVYIMNISADGEWTISVEQ